MRSLAAVFLVAFFILLGIFAIGSWSCQKVPKPNSETQKTENSGPNNCSTLYGIFVVGLSDTGLFVRTYDKEIVAVSTVVIAAFTVILGLFTVSLAQSTRIAAKTAKRAITELERPYLFILDYNWLLTEKARAAGTKYGVGYSVMNAGKLPASIKRVEIGLRFGDSIPHMDDVPPIHELLTGPVIAGGDARLVTQPFADEFEGADPPRECKIRGGIAVIPAMAFQHPRVIAKISIHYDGPITIGHVTTACWEWHPVKYAFTEYGGLEHNQRT